MSDLLLRARGLGCVVESVQLFDGLCFELHGGDMLEVRGPNGCGKSTLLRCLAGLKIASTGTIERELDDCAYLGHKLGIQPSLTVLENLRLFEQLNRFNNPAQKIERVDELLQRFDLHLYRNQLVASLSEGLKRRCALARVWLQDKRIWLLDEPRSALDKVSSSVLNDVIESHRARECAIVFVSHQSLDLSTTRILSLR